MESNRHRGIDLHIHSTASDGTYSPLDLLEMAAGQGLAAISITDHDTLEGTRSALEAHASERFQFMTGVEISAQPPNLKCSGGGSLHILGYGIDPYNKPLQRALDELQQARSLRTPQIIERLNRLGFGISMEQVLAEVGDGSPGRPHVAAVMIKAGYVRDFDEAFDRFLSKGQPAYVDKYRVDCGRAIDLIRQAGGVPVLAHPGLVKCSRPDELDLLIDGLKELGIAGLEVFYPQHSPDMVDRLRQLADQHDLLITGGTDFHGQATPDIQIGRGYGDLFVPFEIYEELCARLKRLSPEQRA